LRKFYKISPISSRISLGKEELELQENQLNNLLREVNYYHNQISVPDFVFNLKHLVEQKADRNSFFLKIFVETELDQFLFGTTRLIKKPGKNKNRNEKLVKVVVGKGLGSKSLIQNLPPLRYYTCEYLKKLNIKYFYDEAGGICFWI